MKIILICFINDRFYNLLKVMEEKIMKKILGVMGSPRKGGNTDILVSKILDGAKEMGANIEKISLNNLDIKECDGCHACWDGRKCSKHDDMNEIFNLIIECDIIIFGTPVYWYGPTGLMKLFLDRFVYFNSPANREKIKDKSAVLAIPFEENDLETARPLVLMFEKSFKYLEIKLIETILAPDVGEKGAILKKNEILDEAYTIGKNIGK
ncbi:MAG: flavodoxin family protein [Candidatus Lokiarchaeota archaeon]|nr:flavodoxin family protein [Candidatus Lokiarchaeota archaeon]